MFQKKLLAPAFIVGIIFVSVLMIKQVGYQSPIYASGQVTLSESLLDKAQEIETLFITLFDSDSNLPMPYGAIKFKVPREKTEEILAFTITKDNLQVMNQNRKLPKHFRIKARLDTTGQGGMDKPGDLTGELNQIAFGQKNLIININKVVSYE